MMDDELLKRKAQELADGMRAISEAEARIVARPNDEIHVGFSVQYTEGAKAPEPLPEGATLVPLGGNLPAWQRPVQNERKKK